MIINRIQRIKLTRKATGRQTAQEHFSVCDTPWTINLLQVILVPTIIMATK